MKAPIVIIYHPNSFGGTYDYALKIFEAYGQAVGQPGCHLLLPGNAPFIAAQVHKILPRDTPAYKMRFFNRLHFLYRSLANPLLLLLFLRKFRNDDIFLIFNEFEQLTAPWWAPVFRRFKFRKHIYGVILHDPDRDAYPPNLAAAQASMAAVMSIMDIAFYHGLLPDRPYYTLNQQIQFVDAPFGMFKKHEPRPSLLETLIQEKTGFTLAAILGNIRPEKNYDLAIRALKHLPQHKLLIAGRAANSGVNVGAYHTLAEELNVNNRVIWLEKFLDDEELAATITAADVILLAYSATFKSQSGMLAMTAPYRKPILASQGESALALAVQTYELGTLIRPDNLEALVKGLGNMAETTANASAQWDKYLEFNTWENHAMIGLQAQEAAKSILN